MATKSDEESLWSFSKPGQRIQWPYDRWFKDYIGKRIRYGFVRKFWDCPLTRLHEAANSDHDQETILKISSLGIANLLQLLDAVSTMKAGHGSN